MEVLQQKELRSQKVIFAADETQQNRELESQKQVCRKYQLKCREEK